MISLNFINRITHSPFKRKQYMVLKKINLNRRSFLKQVAAVSVPIVLPRYVLGMQGQRGANEKIVLAVLGAGRQGMGLSNAFSQIDNVVVAMHADVHRSRGDTQDYRRVLDRKDIDGVVIATPDHWHAPMAIHAAQAGKHIYTEKPVSYTIAEGRKMVEATRHYSVIHQAGSQQRSMFFNYRGCMLVRKGALGKIKKIQAHNYPSPMNNALPGQDIPQELDWDKWCGSGPLVPYNEDVFAPRANPGWLSLREFSGGEMTGWGTHGLDQIQWALGKDDSGLVELWTKGDPFEPWIVKESRPGNFQGPRCPKIFMRYEDGTDGIEVEFSEDAPAGGAVFIGEKGTLWIDRGSARTDPVELTAVRPTELEAMDIQLYLSSNHLLNWLDCIKSGKRPCADIETGHRSATVCHLANIARWTGRRLLWDPVKEKF